MLSVEKQGLTTQGANDEGHPVTTRAANHPRVDARQSQKSIPQIYRGIDVKSRFPLPLT